MKVKATKFKKNKEVEEIIDTENPLFDDLLSLA